MTGIGTGNWTRYNAKTKIGTVLEINIRQLRKAGSLAVGCMGTLDNGIDSVGYTAFQNRFQLNYDYQNKPVIENIYFARYSSNIQGTNGNGQITMFSCPDCDRRTETVYLYKGHFTCRFCADMVYPSQSENRHGKINRQLAKLKTKLNPKVGYRKYMDLRLEESKLSLVESEMSVKQSGQQMEKLDRLLEELS